MTRSILLIVGMHRSGTSALASVFDGFGYDSGQSQMATTNENPVGYFENRRIEAVHQELLTGFGATWDSIAFLKEGWENSSIADHALNSLTSILTEEFSDEKHWMIKDPRLSLFAPLWKRVAEQFDRKLDHCAIVRHPEEVVSSLVIRNNMDPVWAARLYQHYNLSMRNILLGEMPFWLSYDQLLSSPSDAAHRMWSHFNQNEDEEAVIDDLVHAGSLVQTALRHNNSAGYSKTRLGVKYDALNTDFSETFTDRALEKFFDALENSEYLDLLEFSTIDPTITSNEDQPGSILSDDDIELVVSRFMKEKENAESSEHEKILLELAVERKKISDLDILLTKERTENLSKIRELEDMAVAAAVAHDEKSSLKKELSTARSKLTRLRKLNEKLSQKAQQQEEQLSDSIDEISSLQKEVKKKEKVWNDAQSDTANRLKVVEEGWSAHMSRIEARMFEVQGRAAAEKKLIHGKLTDEITELSLQKQEIAMQKEAMIMGMNEDGKHPFRTGTKLLAWGALKTVYKALPVPVQTRQKLRQKVMGKLGRFSPNYTAWNKSGIRLETKGLKSRNIDVKNISFAEVENPDISIIIPVHNQLAHTLTCLDSLQAQSCAWSFEVIVMDDCSTDDTAEVLSSIPNLRVITNENNLRFIKNCNAGADAARGRYLVFLNNDTYLMSHWLQSLRATFEQHRNVGVAGSKLIFENGELQEAGGIIWEDGSGWNWGRGQQPDHPRFNYVRDADYVSGASFMIPRDLFLETGSFDQDLQFAYYEDTSKCFQLRQMGYRVLYQPLSQLVHYEGISNGTDTAAGLKQYQVANQKIFFDKYIEALSTHLPNGADVEIATDRLVRGHILIVDAVTPTPEQDSGSLDMVNLIQILLSQGYRVHFIPQNNFANVGHHTAELQAKGVECIYAPHYTTVEQYVSERGDMFDHVILSRMSVAYSSIDAIEEYCPSANKIFYTVDLHFLREEREAELANDDEMRSLAAANRKIELDLIERCDTTIVLSKVEHEMLTGIGYEAVRILPLLRDVQPRSEMPFSKRSDVAFVGGFQHKPNVDSVDWLLSEIWPSVTKLCKKRKQPPIELKIVGSNMPDAFRNTGVKNVTGVGFVLDLGKFLETTRLTIAPLRYGAGLKGKVATSLEFSVPVVGTSIAFEGMPEEGLDDITLCSDTAEGLAEIIYNAYYKKEKWESASKGGYDYVNRHYSLEAVTPALLQILHSD